MNYSRDAEPETYAIVQKAISFRHDSPITNIADIVNAPPGWVELIHLGLGLIDSLAGELHKIEFIEHRYGFLKVKMNDHTILSEWITRGMAQDSSLLCLVCGKEAWRKKWLDGWPSLCFIHYVEYANAIGEIESV